MSRLRRVLFGLGTLLMAHAAAATPAFVQSRSAQALGTNTVAATFGTNNDPSSDGDHAIVVLARWGNDSGSLAVSDTAGNRFQEILPPVWDGNKGGQTLFAWVALGIKPNVANQVTVTVNGAGNHLLTIALIEYAHIATSGAVDVSSVGSSRIPMASPIACPSVTTTAPGDVILTVFQSAPFTPPAKGSFSGGFVDRENGGSGDGWVGTGRAFLGEILNAPVGTYRPVFSWSGEPARGYGAFTVALRGAR